MIYLMATKVAIALQGRNTLISLLPASVMVLKPAALSSVMGIDSNSHLNTNHPSPLQSIF